MLTDSHAHLDSPRYAEDRQAILTKARQRARQRNFRVRGAAWLLIGFACSLSAIAQNIPAAPNLALRLEASDLKSGVPESFTFVFVNAGTHDVHVPQLGPCSSREEGWLRLQLDYKCVVDGQGFGGGCGGGSNDGPGILAAVRSWKTLTPGESLRIKETRRDMFQTQDCAGKYDFWAEYTPPHLSPADVKILADAGVDFPHEHLTSNHLTFEKKQ